MSIAPLNRVTVIGRAADKQALLGGLQDLGCLHLTSMVGAPPSFDADIAPEGGDAISNARKALKFLTDAPYQRRQLMKSADFSLGAVVDAALDLKTRLRVVGDRCEFLRVRIANVEPWGEIDFSPDGPPGGRYLWFYELPLRQRRALDDVEAPWRIVGTTNRVAYLVVIAPDEPPPDLLPVPRVRVGAAPLADLRAQLRAAEIEMDDLMAERIALTRYVYLLTSHLFEAENAAGLRAAERAAFKDGALTALQGWAPTDRLDDVDAFVQSRGLAFVAETPGPDDAPPTLLVQPPSRTAGVDLSMFYQAPNYRSWDPSIALLISFPIFFAMIMADAGYGLLIGAGLGVFWRRLGRSPRERSYRRLGAWITVATVAYGAAVGSYFGAAPPPDGVLAQLKLLSINDFDVMMKLSIGVGVVHVVIANLMSAYARRGSPDAPSKFGWIAVFIGAYALYVGGAATHIRAVSMLMMGVGGALIFLFSSARPAKTFGDRALRALDGAQALAGAMSAFGDILSYMRLFALGLASASLAVTFNQLAADARAAMPGVGLLAAGLILLLGHGLNFLLAIVSGVVHGLRLNYIEFFNWGFDGEGEAFKPFARKQVEP